MALVPGICTQCGATLSADNSKDCMICPYCGTPFIVEKAINHFSNTYNISNSVVNFYGGESRDFVIRAGVLERYNGADVIVTIPNTVKAIGQRAFSDCFALQEVTISEGVDSIEEDAFSGCKSLKSVSIPNSVLRIGSRAFYGCESLLEITIPKNITVIEPNTFYFCKSLKKVSLPNGIVRVGGNAFSSCENLTEIIFPDSVTVIECGALNGCVRLKKIRTPNNEFRSGDSMSIFMTTLGGCDALQEFVVPNISWRRFLRGSENYCKLIELRTRKGVCLYCGGQFKGVFEKKCTQCGLGKNY